MERTANCLAKLERMNKALHHEEPDRVPISDFFWGGFLARWRRELGLAADTDIYRYYDLDWRVVSPNMDPHIRPFDILRDDETEVTVHTGFGATIRKKFDLPMPAFVAFDTDTIEKMDAFEFDDPFDELRFFRAGDDQINGVGDGFERNLAPFVDRVAAEYADFPVFGSACEAHEMIWRIVGTENVMMWMAEYPDAIARFVERLHEFNLGLVRAQIKAAEGLWLAKTTVAQKWNRSLDVLTVKSQLNRPVHASWKAIKIQADGILARHSCHPDAAHSVNFPTASTLSRAFLRYSNLDGSHLWHCSAESNSASQVAVATVAMHLLQIEFVVPSGLDRRTKSGGKDAILNLGGTRAPVFVSCDITILVPIDRGCPLDFRSKT